MKLFDLNKVLHDQQAAYLERSKNVIPFPTTAQARALHAEGKVIVHKPESLKHFNDDPEPPEAA